MEKIKENKKALAVVALLVLALVAYFTKNKWMPMFSKAPAQTPSTNTSNASSSSSNNTAIDKDKVLKNGDSGASVKELQKILNQELDRRIQAFGLNTLDRLSEDGSFGPKTEARLQLFASVNQISINELNSKFSK